MSGRPEVLDIVRQWVERAEHDLTNAEHTLTLGAECPYDTVCFHAQQCAEKYLKALLVLHGVDFPRTHDLTVLRALVPAGVRLDVSVGDVAELNPYAVEARYPGPWEPLARDEAVRAVEIARSVRSAVRTILPTVVM